MSLGQFLFSLNGRITRSDYWLKYYLPAMVVFILAVVLDGALGLADPQLGVGPITGLMYLALFWPSIAVTVKRLHDRDKSGWFMLIMLIPIIGSIWLLVVVGFLRGTVGPNRFGDDPLGGEAPDAVAVEADA